MSSSSNRFFDQQQDLQIPLPLNGEQVNFTVSGSSPQARSSSAEFLPKHQSDERTSHLESPPMDGGDPLVRIPPTDLSHERQSLAEPPLSMSGADWRTQLPPDARQRIVNKIKATLTRHFPVNGEEGLQELGKFAARFEEKVYNTAISQSDYLRKISLRMLIVETKSQNGSGMSADPQELEPTDGC